MKNVFITGANRGIGLALTKNYLDAGWHVFACCRQPDKAKELHALNAKKSTLEIFQLDVTNIDEINLVAQAIKHQPIDILINNAGIGGLNAASFENVDVEKWLTVLETNTIAPFLVTRALLSNVIQSNRKLIVNISSSMGSIAMNEIGNYYSYRSSKAALNAITKSLAIDLKKQDITVVTVHPGWVKTDMGTQQAPLTPEESAAGIYRTLETLTIKNSGEFISYANERLNW